MASLFLLSICFTNDGDDSALSATNPSQLPRNLNQLVFSKSRLNSRKEQIDYLLESHLLAAADRYGLERLRLLCEANLCDNVVINTALTTLALVEQHRCSHLKSVCLKFVAMPENLRAVMQTEGFEYLKESCPSVLTKLLQYVARISEHSAIGSSYGNVAFLDGTQRPQQ